MQAKFKSISQLNSIFQVNIMPRGVAPRGGVGLVVTSPNIEQSRVDILRYSVFV